MPFKRPLGERDENQRAPNFIRPLSDKRVTVDQKVLLECQVAAHPDPAIKWLKDDRDVSQCPDYLVSHDGNRCQLLIPSVQMSDHGRFTCQALNSAGSKTTSCVLVVAPPPSPAPGFPPGTMPVAPSPAPPPTPVGPAAPLFVKELKHAPLKIGGNLILECRVTAFPPPEIEWLKNGEPIEQSFKHKIENDTDSGICCLQFSMLFAEDIGEFTCQAKNQHGEAVTSCLIMHRDDYEEYISTEQTKITREKKKSMMQELDSKVQLPRPQSRQEQKSNVVSKEQKMIERHVSAQKYQYDRQVITQQQQQQQQEQIEQVGRQYGAQSPEIPGSPPQLASTLKNVRVSEGHDAIFQCSLVGNPRPKLSWMKDGRPLLDSQRCVMSFKNGLAMLMIKMSFPEDSGQYMLSAENPHGQIQASAVLIVEPFDQALQQSHKQTSQHYERQVMRQTQRTVMAHHEQTDTTNQPQNVKAPNFVASPGDMTVREKQSVRFELKLSGRPYPDVEWYKDGDMLRDDKKHKLMINQQGIHSLMISTIDGSDAGQYTCVASNDAGQAECSFHLNVLSADQANHPQFTEKFHSVTVKEGDSTSLRCKVNGKPIPTLVWYKDHNELSNGKPYRIEMNGNEATLYIDKVTAEDAGWFQCNASNQFGTISLRSRISVQNAQNGQSQQVNFLSKQTLQQQMNTAPEVVNLRRIEHRTSTSTSHVYKNELEQSYERREFAKPQYTSQPQNTVVTEGKHAHFECRLDPIDDPSLRIVWLLNGRPLQASSRVSHVFDFGFVTLDISPVHMEDSGTYTCLAANRKGQSETSCTLQVTANQSLLTQSQHPDSLHSIELLENRRHQHGLAQLEESRTREQPNFLQELRDIQVLEGKPVHFEAKLTPVSDPNMSVEWLHNGLPLQHGSRFRVLHDFGYVALDILHTTPEDSGLYTCRAINPLGTAETNGKLACIAEAGINDIAHKAEWLEQEQLEYQVTTQAPVYVHQLRNISTKEGQRCHFEGRVMPQGDPHLKIEWFKDGNPVLMASRIHIQNDFGYVALTLNPVYPEDSGIYTVVATNKAGRAESQATLQCQGRGGLVTDTQHDDAMRTIEYLEQHANRSGRRQDERSEETDSVEAPTVSKGLREQVEVNEGSNVHFECRISPVTDPKMIIEWFHNGSPLQNGHRFRPMNDFGYIALDILYVYPEDSGVYSVVAKNALGACQIESNLVVKSKRTLYLEPQHPEGLERIQQLETPRGSGRTEEPDRTCVAPPRILHPFKELMNLRDGANLRLETRLEPVHDPTMEVKWFVDGKPVLTGSRVRTSTDFGYVCLEIKDTIAADAGLYVLYVVNGLGEAQSQSQINIQAHSNILSETQHEESLSKIQYLETMNRFGRKDEPDVGPFDAPQFVQPLANDHPMVAEGHTAHLECQIQPSADPSLQVEWFRDGKPLPAGHRFRTFQDFGFVSLDILTMYAEDSGVYQCVARNKSGQAATDCLVECTAKDGIISKTHHPTSVQRIAELEAPRPRRELTPDMEVDAPFFTQPLHDIEDIKEGEFVHLECQLSPINDPHLEINWYVNGIPIQNGHRFHTTNDFGYVALNILYIYAEDSGTYACVGKNKLGESFSQCTVSCRGKNSMLVDSYHPSSLKRIYELEAPKLRPNEAEDNPIEAPSFLAAMDDLVGLKEGQTAHLECQVQPMNDPNLRVEWLHDGKPLTAGHRFRTVHDFGYVALDILYVYPEDSGKYTCRATGSAGVADISANITCSGKRHILTDANHPESWKKLRAMEESVPAVPTETEPGREAPRFIKELTGSLELRESQAAHIEAQVSPANDNKLKVKWYHNGTALKIGHRFRTVHDFGYVSLDILYVYPEDTGTYTVKVINELGEAKSSSEIVCKSRQALLLDSQHPKSLQLIRDLEAPEQLKEQTPDRAFGAPQFTIGLENVNVEEGGNIELKCRVQPIGDGSLRVIWLRNNKPIPEGHRFKCLHDFDLVTLQLLTVYPEDEGVYSCRAINIEGEATVSCTVKCAAKDSLLLKTQNEQSWKRIQELERRPDRQDIIDELPSVQPSFAVQLRSPPTLSEGHAVHLECQVLPASDAHLEIQWYHDGQPLSAGHRFRVTHDFGYVALDILYAFPEDSGTWTCKAVNKVGQAATEVAIQVQPRRTIDNDTLHEHSLQEIKRLETPRVLQPPPAEASHEAPLFKNTLTTIERIEGQPAHFEARLLPLADPTMKVEWFVDGVPIRMSNRTQFTHDFGYISLDIGHVLPEDAGMFIVKATNAAGEATSNADLIVKERSSIYLDTQHPSSLEKIRQLEMRVGPAPDRPETPLMTPHFTQELNSCNDLIEGQPAHFEALLQPVQDPNLQVEWLKDGNPLPASSRITLHHDFGFVSLDIHYTLPEDAGIYSCRAVNKLGEAISSGQMQCRARSSVYLETMHQSSLEKIHLMEAPKEAAPQPEALIVQKPQFTQSLTSAPDAIEGESALLECRLIPVNDPKLKVEWFHNDQPILISNRISTTHDFGYVALQLKHLQGEDRGTYMCRATNDLGEAVTTSSIELSTKESIIRSTRHPESIRKIQELEGIDKNLKPYIADREFEKPAIIEPLVNHESVKEGDPVSLICKITPVGDPTMKIQWFRNDHLVDFSNRFNSASDFGYATLDIKYIYPEDSGIYSCKVTNEHGEAVTSALVKVAGFDAIQLRTQHPDRWQKIQNMENIQKPVTAEPIIQHEKPRFTSALENQEDVPEGQPIHLQVTFEPARDSTMRVEWEKNGKPVPAGQLVVATAELGTATLNIVTAYPEHSGLYTVKLTNSVGEAATSATIRVIGSGSVIANTQHAVSWQRIQEIEAPKLATAAPADAQFPPPTFQTHLNNVDVTEGQSAHFECQLEPAKDPALTVELLLNDKPLAAGSKYKLTVEFGRIALDIQYCYPEDSGVYKVKAVNKQGEAMTAGTLKCQSKASIITDPQQANAMAKIAELEAPKAGAPDVAAKPIMIPNFTSPLVDLGELVEGQAAHFQATVEPIDVQTEWLHNGHVVETSSRIKIVSDFGYVILDISTTEPRDSGEWTVRAFNSDGEVSSKANLNIEPQGSIDLSSLNPHAYAKIQEMERPKAPGEAPTLSPPQTPKFIVPLTGLPDLDEGDSVHLEAQLTPVDDPRMKVEWFHNGKPIPIGHRYKPIHDFGFCVLDILYTMPEDSGEFTCKASNQAGSDTTTVNLKCLGKARLNLQPQAIGEKVKAIYELEESLRRVVEVAPAQLQKQAPVFIEPLKTPPKMIEGGSAYFNARFTPLNDPDLKVEWLWNGVALKTGSRVKTISDFGVVILEIFPVYSEDSGVYTCKVSNQLGEAVTSADMICQAHDKIVSASQLPERMSGAQAKIRELETPKVGPAPSEDPFFGVPKFLTPLTDLDSLIEGQLAHLECQVEPVGDPRLKIEWFLEGKPIFHSSRMKMIHDFGFVIMEIAPAEPHDTGIYVCKATNDYGEAATQCRISVEGRRGVSYEWQMPASMHRERITELEASLNKNYQPEVEADKNFGPPVFTEGLVDLGEIIEADNAHFECKLEPVGDPTMKIQWLHNGQPVPYGSRIQPHHDFGFIVLDIQGLIPQDSGEYVCRATNAKGSTETTSQVFVKSKIEVDPPVFVTPIVEELQGIQEGDTVHLECRVTPINDPKLTIQWFHNGKPLPASHRYKMVYDFGYISLDILYAHPEDAGAYVCRAVNDKGQAETSCNFTVQGRPNLVFQRQAPKESLADLERHLRQYTRSEIVLKETDFYNDSSNMKPVFRSDFQPIVINESDFARFEAQLAPINDPNMKIEWYFNKRPLMLGHRFRPIHDYGFVALDLLLALPQDSGEYTAKATNKFGSATSTAKLVVGEKNRIITDSQLPQGYSVQSISKMEQGNSEIYWTETIETENVQRVKAAPTFTIKPRSLRVVENEPARFECAVSGFPRPRVSWYINGKECFSGSRFKLSYDGMHYLIVSQVRPVDAGDVLVVARNAVGEAQALANLDVFLNQDFRYHRLRSATRITDEEIYQKEEHWKHEMMGQLGQHFAATQRADLTKLHRVEGGRPAHYPLESDELKTKFNRKREEDFYEKIIAADHIRPHFPPPSVQPVNLKPAHVIRRELPREEMEPVELRPAPKTERTAEIVPELPSLAKLVRARPFDEEEEARRFGLKPIPQRDPEVAAKDMVQLKPAKQNAPNVGQPFILEEPTPQPSVKQRPFGVKAPVRTPKETVKMEHTKTKAPTPETHVELPKVELKQTPRKEENVKSDEHIITKVEEHTEIREIGGKRARVHEVRLRTARVVNEEKTEWTYPSGVAMSKPGPSTKQQAPGFAHKLQPVQAEIGKSTRFYVEFSGAQPVTVTWLRDEQRISSSFEFQVKTTDRSSTLEIPRVKSQYAGDYCVRLENVAGSAESIANLFVQEKVEDGVAPTFTQLPDAISTYQGEPIRITAKVQGKPQPTITWFKDGRQITTDNRVHVSINGETCELIIDQAYPQDNGQYECVAKTGKGESRCKFDVKVSMGKPASMIQAVAPQIVEPMKPQLIQDGGSAIFACKITGTPEPKVQWSVNKRPIQPGNFYSVSKEGNIHTLTLSSAHKEDEGEYMCQASNAGGSSSFAAPLKIAKGNVHMVTSSVTKTSSPRCEKLLQDQDAKLGQSIRFETDFSAEPVADMTWLHNGKDVSSRSDIKVITTGLKSTLEIASVQDSHGGQYLCRAKNSNGIAETAAHLHVGN